MHRRLGFENLKTAVGLIVGFAVMVAIVAIIKLDTAGQKGSGLGSEFIYDINELAKIDPNLILYEESVEPIGTGFKTSRAIAIGPDHNIYIAGDHAIRVFAESGNMLNEIRLDVAPGCLAVADDGKIYVGIKDHLEVYDNGGGRLATWQSLGNRAFLTSIAVLKNDVFVADAGNRVVIRYDSAGNLINHIGQKDSDRNIPGLVIPSPYFDLAIGYDGLLRVVNPGRHRIEAYTFDGDLEFWWGKFSMDVEGFCGCCNPVNFAILEDESFVTCEKGIIRVKIYDAEGSFVGVVAGPEQLVEGNISLACLFPDDCQSGSFDVAVDRKGRILVLDTIRNAVRIYTKKKE